MNLTAIYYNIVLAQGGFSEVKANFELINPVLDKILSSVSP